MDLDLAGKHALVCGASEGIGRAAARELALLGADVTLLARRAEVLEALAADLPRVDGQAHGWVSADVLDTILVNAAVESGARFESGLTVTGVQRDESGRVVGVTGRDCHLVNETGAALPHLARNSAAAA